MLAAQSGIVAVGTGSHAYLELTLQSGVAPIHLAEALAALPEQRTTTGGLNLVAGFRPTLWSRIAPASAPCGFTDFDHAVRGGRRLRDASDPT